MVSVLGEEGREGVLSVYVSNLSIYLLKGEGVIYWLSIYLSSYVCVYIALKT